MVSSVKILLSLGLLFLLAASIEGLRWPHHHRYGFVGPPRQSEYQSSFRKPAENSEPDVTSSTPDATNPLVTTSSSIGTDGSSTTFPPQTTSTSRAKNETQGMVTLPVSNDDCECEDPIKVKLIQTLPISPSNRTILNCTFDRPRMGAVILMLFWGPTYRLFYYDYWTQKTVYQYTYVKSANVNAGGYWASFTFEYSKCIGYEDFSCYVAAVTREDGQASSLMGVEAVPEIYWKGSCLTCSGPKEIYLEEIQNITLTCKVNYVRPEVNLMWDEPLKVVPGGEKSTPIKSCYNKYFDQESTASALFDGTSHWHVCCTSLSTHVDGRRFQSKIVTFKYRPAKEPTK